MKKIQLSDGMPTDIELENQSDEVKELFYSINRIALYSGLNYAEINKALYLSDKELYKKAIMSPL